LDKFTQPYAYFFFHVPMIISIPLNMVPKILPGPKISLAERRWSAFYAGWLMYFGEEIVAQVISQAAGLAHLPLPERIPALVDSVADSLRKCRWGTSRYP
jgi:hypothetical protein